MRGIMLILHFCVLTMGLNTSFAHAFLRIVVSKMMPDVALPFRWQSLDVSKMENIGIIILIVSGLYLLIPYWQILFETPLFFIKLGLVNVLTILIALIKMSSEKALTGEPDMQLGNRKIW